MTSPCLLELMLLAISVSAPGQDVPAEPPATRILQQALEAHGLVKHQHRFAAVSWKVEGEVLLPTGKMPYQSDWTQADFNVADAALSLEVADRKRLSVRTYLNGKEGWRQRGD